MIWFTSDLHFNHLNILKYEAASRPFADITEMNEALIANWNSVVKENDTIYVLGDFFMGQPDSVQSILNRLNGRIILVRGNHDGRAKLDIYRANGIEIHDITYLSYKGRFFILCHFPIASPEFIEMVRRDNAETVVLYGHLHGNAPTGYHEGTYHIGADTNNLTPISIEQIWQECWPDEMMTPAIKLYRDEHNANPDME